MTINFMINVYEIIEARQTHWALPGHFRVKGYPAVDAPASEDRNVSVLLLLDELILRAGRELGP